MLRSLNIIEPVDNLWIDCDNQTVKHVTNCPLSESKFGHNPLGCPKPTSLSQIVHNQIHNISTTMITYLPHNIRTFSTLSTGLIITMIIYFNKEGVI